jgi:SAM-dependent methyltransferase
MKLNEFEFALMNNPIRALSQRRIETPLLIGRGDVLAGKRVLEMGCGRGVGMEILLSLGAAHVTGFDLDPRMVTQARERTAKYTDRAHVFVGDAEAIDVPNTSYDVVVEYGILHHVPDWRQAQREIARALKPNGVFYFEDLLKGLISSLPMPVFFRHPQNSQFLGREFYSGLHSAGLRVQAWRQWGELAIMGSAVRVDTPIASSQI